MCNLSYVTTQICSCMCRMQLNFSCKRQLQNPKFLVVLRFDNPFCVEAFCLLKESNKILSYVHLFYSFQNPVVHRKALTCVIFH